MNTTVLPISTRLYSAYPVTIEAYTQSDDERKIRKVFARLAGAWNIGDASQFASLFTEDCDYITFRGEHIIGRRNNEDLHAQLFKTFLADTSLVTEVKQIKFISEDVAVVHCLGAVNSKHKNNPAKDKVNTNVLVKSDGVWRIAAFHNSKIERKGVMESVMEFFRR
jgi:uncharacterized protein (TIGR02246 family)